MNAPAFTLSATCLDAQGGGALCLHADWPHEGLVLKGQALPLTLVHPLATQEKWPLNQPARCTHTRWSPATAWRCLGR